MGRLRSDPHKYHKPVQNNTEGKRNMDVLLRREVYKDFCKGITDDVIFEKICNDGYNVGKKYSEKSARRFVNMINSNMCKDYDDKTTRLYKPRILAYYMDLYRECRETHDRGNAVRILKEIGMMIGAYEQVENKIENNMVSISFGFDDQQQIYDGNIDESSISDKANEKPEESIFANTQPTLSVFGQ